jgi:hypothetical protein
MVGSDSWCPSCGYSVDPGTRFCGGCGQQLAADGASAGQSSPVTMQSPPAAFPGYPASAALPAPVGSLPPPPAGSAPPPPAGNPLPWPPPPPGAPVQPPGAGPGQAPISDTLEQMLRPQGLFQHRLPPPVEWQQPYPPGHPGGPQHPQASPYQQGGSYPPPPGGQYPATGAFQQAGPPPPWPQAPTGALPPAPGGPASGGTVPASYAPGGQPPPTGQWPQAGAYPGPYGNGQYAGAPPGPEQYGQTQFAQPPIGPAQYGQTQFAPEQFPPGQFGPGAPYGPDGTPAGAARRPGLLGKLPFKRPLVPLAAGGGLVAVLIAAVVLSQGGSSPGPAGTAATASPAAPASAGGAALTQQQAATSLSGLLAQSGTDHADVNAAVANVEGCKGLAADARTFTKAAANRGTLLAKLAQLPGRSALPAAMITDLTSGWQASATVDTDLAKWAAAEAGHCKKNDLKNPAYAASLPFDSKATNGKSQFVRQWNGLARKYGLAAYQPSQI